MDFVDTKVLLYAASTNARERDKSERARLLLQRDDLAVSVQVLQEFYVQATRSGRSNPLSHDQAVLLVEAFSRFPVQELTVDVMRAGFETKRRFQRSYWDAAIIEAARALGCAVVLTEDLGDGQDYGGVTAHNPFV